MDIYNSGFKFSTFSNKRRPLFLKTKQNKTPLLWPSLNLQGCMKEKNLGPYFLLVSMTMLCIAFNTPAPG